MCIVIIFPQGDCHTQVYSIKFHLFDIKVLFTYHNMCAKLYIKCNVINQKLSEIVNKNLTPSNKPLKIQTRSGRRIFIKLQEQNLFIQLQFIYFLSHCQSVSYITKDWQWIWAIKIHWTSKIPFKTTDDSFVQYKIISLLINSSNDVSGMMNE